MSVLNNQANIQTVVHLILIDDFTTLEYDDRVMLTFTPMLPSLFSFLEAEGEFIRNIAIVSIIDNDSKSFSYTICALKILSPSQCWR